jgi:predicted component of type VI protein secretion system
VVDYLFLFTSLINKLYNIHLKSIHQHRRFEKIMAQEESLIQTSSVNIGANLQKSTSSQPKDVKPWVFLVCGDFGYTDQQPRFISSGTIQDFLKSCNVEIKGRVEQGLPEFIEPFTVSTQVASLSDFSEELILQKCQTIKSLMDAKAIVDSVVKQQMSSSDATAKIRALELAPPLKQQITIALSAEVKPQSAPQSSGSFADSIMSMLDTGTPQTSPLENLINVLGDDSNSPGYRANQLTKVQLLLADIIEKTAAALRSSSHYSTIASSWYALRNLLKKMGRSKLFEVYLYSGASENAFEHYQSALASLVNDGNTPDIILLSYENNNLDIDVLDTLHKSAAIAEAARSMVWTSFAQDDPCIERIISADTDAQETIDAAIDCLRNESAARSIVLCGPSLHISSAKDNLIAGGAWILADHWVSTLLSTGSPFDMSSLTTSEIIDDQLVIQIPPHRVKEIANAGFTFVRIRSGRIIIAPSVMLNAAGNESYASVGFNMLLNRTVRLAENFIAVDAIGMTPDTLASALEQYLKKQLEPYGVISPLNALTVTLNGSELSIALNSQSVIDGNSIHFEFSFDI